MPVNLALNLAALERRAERALAGVAQDLDAELHDQLNSPNWAWPHDTRRKGGAVAGTSRDIVDTGALEDSQQLAQLGALHHQWTWNVPYAAAVFLGAVFKRRHASLPARNIAWGAFGQLNVATAFARHWRSG